MQNRNIETRHIVNYQKIFDFCTLLRGNCLVMLTIETLNAFIDTFFDNVQHTINVDFKTFKLENSKYDVKLRKYLGEIKPLPPQFEQKINKSTIIKSKLRVQLTRGFI